MVCEAPLYSFLPLPLRVQFSQASDYYDEILVIPGRTVTVENYNSEKILATPLRGKFGLEPPPLFPIWTHGAIGIPDHYIGPTEFPSNLTNMSCS
jgi:hypothetical protein